MRTLILAIILTVTACGSSARLKTIRATYDVTNVASERLATFSAEHERKLLAEEPARGAYDAKFADWRAKVDLAEKGLAAVYKAIAAAALLNDDRSLAALVQAALILRTELQALGVTTP